MRNGVSPNSLHRSGGETARWTACFALAFALHAGGAAALLARWNDEADPIANAPVILIDLAPVPAAPATEPTEQPPGPQQAEAQPEPEPEPVKPLAALEQPPTPAPDPVPAVTPPNPPEPEKPQVKREKRASVASAPSPAEQKAERAVAAAPGAAGRSSDAIPSWRSQVAAKLERSKRYPPEARARGEQGVAQLAFSIDRGGAVHGARIVRSTGSSALDRETLDLVARAQPLPPPPPELSGSRIAVTVPIRYTIR